MRSTIPFAGLLFVSLAACGSDAASQNVDSKSTFAFEGDGWQHHTDSGDEYWQKGALTVIGSRIDGLDYTSAESWADEEYDALVGYAERHNLTTTKSLLPVVPLGARGGYEFGWASAYEDAYEAYFIEGTRGLHLEIHGGVVSETDAEAVFKTAHFL